MLFLNNIAKIKLCNGILLIKFQITKSVNELKS